MPLPMSSLTAAEAYDEIRRYGRQGYGMAGQLQTYLASGSVLSSYLLDVATQAAMAVAVISEIRNTPGLADYTRAQLGAAPETDVGAELTTAVVALAQLAAAIRAEYPKDADGFLRDRTFQLDGQVAPVSIAAADLPATAAALTAFLDTLI